MQLSRRKALQVIGFGTVGTAATTAFKCDGPKVDVEFALAKQVLGAISSTLSQLQLPGPLGLVTKAVAILTTVQQAYQDGKFTDAISFMNELVSPGGLFDQILDDASVQQDKTIKTLMIALNGALRVIIVIIEAHQDSLTGRKLLSPDAQKKADVVLRLADEKTIDHALKALRF